MKPLIAIFFILFGSSFYSNAGVRDCAKPERWAASKAQVHLQNAGYFKTTNILNNQEADHAKTNVILLAQEKLKKNVYRQIQKVIFTKKNGDEITVITENEASNDECSLGEVKIYVVKETLNEKLIDQ